MLGFARKNCSNVTPVFSLKALSVLASWFKLQQPLRRLSTWDTLITSAVRGTFKSSTAYSGGMAPEAPSDSSELLSGSSTSKGFRGARGGFGGRGSEVGAGAASAALAPAPASGPTAAGGSVPQAAAARGTSRCGAEPAAAALLWQLPAAGPLAAAAASGRPAWLQLAALLTGRVVRSSGSGCGVHNFFSFQPEFAKPSVISRGLGVNLGTQIDTGSQAVCCAPAWVSPVWAATGRASRAMLQGPALSCALAGMAFASVSPRTARARCSNWDSSALRWLTCSWIPVVVQAFASPCKRPRRSTSGSSCTSLRRPKRLGS